MWTEVYFSQNHDKVQRLVEILNSAQIISRVRRSGDSGSSECFVVLVPRTELDEAQGLLVESDLF